MIRDGTFRLIGIKQRDISDEINSIMDQARDFLIICGYSFTNFRNVGSPARRFLNSTAGTKHCILPIHLFRSRDANRPLAREMIRSGVSVSLESENHSKWIMSESQIYFGSANFTIASLQRRIEVASFKDFRGADNLRREFVSFCLSSISRMYHNSDRRRLWGLLRVNDRLLRSAVGQIQAFNPSIEKVRETVNSVNNVRTLVFTILENCYWFLEDSEFTRLVGMVDQLEGILKSVNFNGSDLLALDAESPRFKQKVYFYNKNCRKFLQYADELSIVSRKSIPMKGRSPRFTRKNREHCRLVMKVLKRYVSD